MVDPQADEDHIEQLEHDAFEEWFSNAPDGYFEKIAYDRARAVAAERERCAREKEEAVAQFEAAAREAGRLREAIVDAIGIKVDRVIPGDVVLIQKLREAVAAERERAAKVCEAFADRMVARTDVTSDCAWAAEECADAIRRGEK